MPENIPLGECPLSRSREQLTPPSRSDSTVFTLSGAAPWPSEASRRRRCRVFWLPAHLMSTGGGFLLCGAVVSGLYFAGHCRRVTNILGPALVSIGLMVLVVGVVLVPITKENRLKAGLKKPLGYSRPLPLHL